jgi:hypothetical protein
MSEYPYALVTSPHLGRAETSALRGSMGRPFPLSDKCILRRDMAALLSYTTPFLEAGSTEQREAGKTRTVSRHTTRRRQQV